MNTMSEEIRNNIREAFVSAIGECDVNDESASRGIDSACDVATGAIAHWKDLAEKADADRERTYQENRILTALWCGLRDKVRALPKSDMTIGSWCELQDFVKNQSHTDGQTSNAKLTRPAVWGYADTNEPASGAQIHRPVGREPTTGEKP